MPIREFSPLDGALLVDKPAGPTSHDVVDVIRHQFQLKKVGHCGTLDPGATGLLVLVLGLATRLSDKFMAADKVYEGAIKLGEVTDSYDADGKVLASAPVPPVTLEQLNELAAAFEGDQMQVPPMVSAVKKDGVPLYKLARKGIEVERKERLVHIYRFRFVAVAPPLAWFRVACTKGTYVRTLAHDFGQRLGCGAHLKHLRRTASGQFDVAQATPYEEILRWSPADLEAHIIPFLKLVRME
ncbi:tRNA pseudouridine(55) synthase TruB [Fontisphaera persica]|uniref:tRNA pseudouridine(55) synthase TruB n=1 Tax=Fontisphaera persica TaxID=2974023 RepID=UPI0024C02209|nr:tRNA pseudouridine(55) synthase TruB [Fontisphaera persica]WCJ58741.1 tRNA pseudouridine(55) synthase TruB [Fontisphaera persica]